MAYYCGTSTVRSNAWRHDRHRSESPPSCAGGSSPASWRRVTCCRAPARSPADWHVAIATATRVHAALRDAGLAETLPGVGVVVRRPKIDRPGAGRFAAGRCRGGYRGRHRGRRGAGRGLDAPAGGRARTPPPMSLYCHVADKDDLLLKMLDAVLARVARAGARRRRLARVPGGRGPWTVAAVPAAPVAGGRAVAHPAGRSSPSGIAWTEWVLDALAVERCLDRRPVRHPAGAVQLRPGHGDRAWRPSRRPSPRPDWTPTQWMDTQLPALRAIVDDERRTRTSPSSCGSHTTSAWTGSSSRGCAGCWTGWRRRSVAEQPVLPVSRLRARHPRPGVKRKRFQRLQR